MRDILCHKSRCFCGLAWSHPQDVVVFILNAATESGWLSPWDPPLPWGKVHERIYRPATHPIHFAADSPDKIIAALRGRYFSFSQIKSYVVVQSSKICFWLLTAQLQSVILVLERSRTQCPHCARLSSYCTLNLSWAVWTWYRAMTSHFPWASRTTPLHKQGQELRLGQTATPLHEQNHRYLFFAS